ncbi:hypothetical protein K7I13_07710 [Brucepastera parasyntrophica]|uniref:hypothetical protein n=1 Tax=Brucepastera parasyntrophica TaxID=2880008 RepID=UPI00210CDCD1|nr:hypothetical protein [Brucepastera parasyntrophica]ULQ58463.1 hypothetical protein K7I13_07710 [Brucepastera parasyntrophica]
MGKEYAYWFPVIMTASEGVVINPERIIPGMNLVIPDLQKNINDEGARAVMKESFLTVAEDYRRIGKGGVAEKLVKIADTL